MGWVRQRLAPAQLARHGAGRAGTQVRVHMLCTTCATQGSGVEHGLCQVGVHGQELDVAATAAAHAARLAVTCRGGEGSSEWRPWREDLDLV